jgi:hypothetical protein
MNLKKETSTNETDLNKSKDRNWVNGNTGIRNIIGDLEKRKKKGR